MSTKQKLLKAMIHTSKTDGITRSTVKLKMTSDSSLSHNVPRRQLLVSKGQDKNQDLATQNLRCPPMALVAPTVLYRTSQASMLDQLRSEAEIMCSRALDLSKETISRADQRLQSSITTPLDPKERLKKLCFALMLHAMVASRTKLLTSRISMELIEFKEPTRHLFSGEVDFIRRILGVIMPVPNSALSREVCTNNLERPEEGIHSMGLTVGE